MRLRLRFRLSGENWSRGLRWTVPLQSRSAVEIVDPVDLLGLGLDIGQVEVDDHRLLAGADDARRTAAVPRLGVDLLVRDVRRDVDEVPRPGLGDELEALSPSASAPGPRRRR